MVLLILLIILIVAGIVIQSAYTDEKKKQKRFGLSLKPSNRCLVPFTVQIDLLPVIFPGTIPFGPPFSRSIIVTLPTVLTADRERIRLLIGPRTWSRIFRKIRIL
jgi:hypothetical protein